MGKDLYDYTYQYYFPRDRGVHCEDYGIGGKLNFNHVKLMIVYELGYNHGKWKEAKSLSRIVVIGQWCYRTYIYICRYNILVL